VVDGRGQRDNKVSNLIRVEEELELHVARAKFVFRGVESLALVD